MPKRLKQSRGDKLFNVIFFYICLHWSIVRIDSALCVINIVALQGVWQINATPGANCNDVAKTPVADEG